jgi:hypothetical protein
VTITFSRISLLVVMLGSAEASAGIQRGAVSIPRNKQASTAQVTVNVTRGVKRTVLPAKRARDVGLYVHSHLSFWKKTLRPKATPTAPTDQVIAASDMPGSLAVIEWNGNDSTIEVTESRSYYAVNGIASSAIDLILRSHLLLPEEQEHAIRRVGELHGHGLALSIGEVRIVSGFDEVDDEVPGHEIQIIRRIPAGVEWRSPRGRYWPAITIANESPTSDEFLIPDPRTAH